jgi:hypothetical protein
MNIFNIGTFFFLSLGILFVLCCLLVYHFKRRLDLFEQKSDTIFEIVNNILSEISNIKQKQNVLFMLAKSTPSVEVANAEETTQSDAFEIEEEERKVETKIIQQGDDRIFRNRMEENEEDADEDRYNNDYEDDTEECDDEDYVEEGEDKDDDRIFRNRMEEVHSGMLNKTRGFQPDTEFSSEIKKIKVVDDEENIIDLTTSSENDDIPHHALLSFNSFFPQINERIAGANSVGNDRIFRNGMTENERTAGANSVGDDRIFRNGMEDSERNEMSDDILDIDMKILNLHSLQQLHSKLFNVEPYHNNDEFNIQILNDIDDSGDLHKIVEVLEDEDDIYKDMPPLEPVERYIDDINEGIAGANSVGDDRIFIHSTPENTPNINDDAFNTSIEEEVKETQILTGIELDNTHALQVNESTDETMSIISEDGTTYKKSEKQDKNEKMGGYRKLSVQTLRELAVSKGLIQDASKLKKGDLLNLLMV